jgi:hypothetical protein
MIAASLLDIEFVISIILWKSFSSYVVHDVSEPNKRQKRLS